MSVSNALFEWFKTCPYVAILSDTDIHELGDDPDSMGLYKQPTQEVVDFIDGSQLVNAFYYFLIKKPAQLKTERISNEEYLENISSWIEEQEETENYPIGYTFDLVEMVNGIYMMSRDEEEAIYQVSLVIQYRKEK